MIEITCPACGAGGRAPNDKVLTRLVCRKCLKIFHVTQSGKSVLGEPPTMGQTHPSGTHHAHPDPTQKVDQWFDRASRRLFSPVTLVMAAVVLLGAVLAGFFSAGRKETLQDRVVKVARATVEGDLRTVKELAADGTETDVDLWYVELRPQCDALRKNLNGTNKLAVETAFKPKEPGQDWVEVVAQVSIQEDTVRKATSLPDASENSAPPMTPVTLAMIWRSAGWGGWQLDGRRTQEIAKVAQP